MTIGLDLSSTNTEKCNLLCKLDLEYNTNGNYKVVNAGDNVKILYEGDNHATFRDSVYNLYQVLLFYPPYHRLDNIKYDAELILIHKHRVSQNHLFISVFLEVDDETNTSTDNFFKEISTNIPRKTSTEKVNLDLPKDFSLNKLLPGLKSFYNYKLEFGTKNETTHHYVIFKNVIPIYYEYYINIKKLLKYRQRDYLLNNDLILYYNKNLKRDDIIDRTRDKLHFVKCRKVRKTIKESEEEVIKIEGDLPEDVESGIKTIVWIISYISTFLLVVLIIKLINRGCLVERFTDALIEIFDKTSAKLKGLWNKAKNVGGEGVDAIKRKRGGPGAKPPGAKPGPPKPPGAKPGPPKPPKIKPPKPPRSRK